MDPLRIPQGFTGAVEGGRAAGETSSELESDLESESVSRSLYDPSSPAASGTSVTLGPAALGIDVTVVVVAVAGTADFTPAERVTAEELRSASGPRNPACVAWKTHHTVHMIALAQS